MTDDKNDDLVIQAAETPEYDTESKKAQDKDTAQHFLSRSEKVEISGRAAEKKNKSIAGFAKKMLTESDDIKLTAFLPSDVIGGSVPYVAGMEDSAVWNAASQACGTETIHYCYTIDEGRCWYLAVPSSSLASAPDTWCPLAAALPGNSEYWDKESVYLYEQEGLSGALRWDIETGRMQIFIGTSRIILPKMQSLEANFVSINAENAKQFKWNNRALNREKLSRDLMRMSFFSGLMVTALAIFVWMGSFIFTTIITPELKEAEELTKQATFDLLIEATKALNTDIYSHFAKLNTLMDALPKFGGTLLRYEVMDNGSVEWEALVPRALEGDISQFRAKAIGLEKGDGRLRIRGSR